MEEESTFGEKALNFVRSNMLFIALFAGGVTFLGIGLIQMFGTKTAEIKFEKGAEVAGTEASLNGEKIEVDVDGEVLKPGLYTLNSDARVQDALIAAGGLTSEADRKAINLAAKVADGQKIYVPGEGERVPAVVSSIGSSEVIGVSSNGLVSINSGSESELDTLPGVGPATIQKIISGRPYSSIEELVSKNVVGQKTFEKISGLISL